jgi:uncharacterized protein
VRGSLSIEINASCARCAEEFADVRSRSFRYVFAPRAMGYDTEEGTNSDDLELAVYDGEEFDLTPPIREQTLLALADRPLCKEDCQGLCPHCGINLNQAKCDCQNDTLDSRLAILRTLRVNRA